MLHLLISCWFPWNCGEVGGGNPFLKVPMISEKTHRGRFPCRVSLWALCKWTATASTREGGEGVQSSQQEQAFAFVPRSWLFHTCWASPRRDCLWFPTWKKALAFRTLSPERGCGDLQIQPLPPPFSETAKRVLRIMTNVSSNRLLPSVSGRRQPRALATATGNS